MGKIFLIGIAGGSGSGKTTFAKKVMKGITNLDSSMLHMDSYYLPSQPKTNYTSSGKANFDHPNAFSLYFHVFRLLDRPISVGNRLNMAGNWLNLA